MITDASQILTLANIYSQAHGLDLKTVSSRCFADSKKLHAIESRDADLTLKRAREAVQWFSDNWPKGSAWPRSITRPSKTGAAA